MENIGFYIEKVDKREIMNTEYEIPVPYIFSDGSIKKEQNGESSFEGALRQSIVSDILCAANVTKTVTEGGLYKVIGKPLQQNSFGEFSGVYRNGTGSISGHAKFENAGFSNTQIAGQLLSQCMLIYIAAELQDIKHEIEDIKEELFLRYVREVLACIETANKELELYSQKRHDLTPIRVQLNNNVSALRQKIADELKKISLKPSLFENIIKTKHDDIEKKTKILLHAFNVLVNGMKLSACLYACADSVSGYKCFCTDIQQVKKEIEFKKFFECCRFLEYNENTRKMENNIRIFPQKIDNFFKIEQKQPVLFIDSDTIKQYSYRQIKTAEVKNG